jgi:hypothetical protein
VLGFFSFTEITDPSAHRAYNEWHQFDHLPEQFTIPGITFGQRWVCSPRCVEARVAVSPLLAPCHYMTLYFLRDEAVLPEFFDLARQLHAADRFFEARISHLSGPFRVASTRASPAARVSAGAVPFRPAAGVYVVVGPDVLPGAPVLGEVSGVSGEWRFSDGERSISVAFVEGDLWAAADELGRRARELAGPLEWAGPLERVDAYQWRWFD